MVVPIEGRGTDEQAWSQWDAVAKWPDVDLAALEHTVVVAPHPDDEVLAVGGLLASSPDCTLVAVTDGEASHPVESHPVEEWAEKRRRGQVRVAETTEALRRLGASPAMVRLSHPDGGIDEARLAYALADLLKPQQTCLATWRGDGHPDHEVVGRAAAAACEMTGSRLWEYPVWMWHWASPDDARVPWETACRFDLPEPLRLLKLDAIEAFQSQIKPIDGTTMLPPHVLDRFRRPYEVVFV